jgi:hypothetical protein
MVRRTLLLLTLAVACDSKPAASAPAKAEEAKESEEAVQKRMADRRAKREADEKAKLEAAEKMKTTLAALAVLPDKKKIEKNAEKACAAVGAAHDRFMQKHFTGEALEKWTAAKGTAIPMTIVNCTKAASVEVAACQAHALDNAPVELKDEASGIMRACIDKFGPASAHGAAAQAGGAVPKKRPG